MFHFEISFRVKSDDTILFKLTILQAQRAQNAFILTVTVFSNIDVYSYKGIFTEVDYIPELVAIMERKEQRN